MRNSDGTLHNEEIHPASLPVEFLQVLYHPSGRTESVCCGESHLGGFTREFFDLGDGGGQPLRVEGIYNMRSGPAYAGFVSYWNEDGSLDAALSGCYEMGRRLSPEEIAPLLGGTSRAYWVDIPTGIPPADDARFFLGTWRDGYEVSLTISNGEDAQYSGFRETWWVEDPPRARAGYWVCWLATGEIDAQRSHYYVDAVRADPRESNSSTRGLVDPRIIARGTH